MPKLDARPRRGFLGAVTGALGALTAAMVGLPVITFLRYSAAGRTVTGGTEPIRVAAPEDIRPGKPLKVNIYGPRYDGWMRLERMKLGAAWLIRTGEGRVRAFSNICPHLGCGVDWNDGAERFDCPCHNSGFGLDGRCLRGPSPRGLDELEVVASDKEIRIRHQRFKLSVKEKEPLG